MLQGQMALPLKAQSMHLTDDDIVDHEDVTNEVTDPTAKPTMITMSRLATPTKSKKRRKNVHDVPRETVTPNGTIKTINQQKKLVMETIHQKIAEDDNADDAQATNLATTRIALIANGTMMIVMIVHVAADVVVEVATVVVDVVVVAAVIVDAVGAVEAPEDVDHTVVAVVDAAAEDVVAVMTLKSRILLHATTEK